MPSLAGQWIFSAKARVFLSLLLISVLLYRLDLHEIVRNLSEFDPIMGFLMLSLNTFLFLVFAKRWQLIAAGLQFKMPYRKAIHAIWLGSLLGQFGPTLVVAEATRFQMLRRYATNGQLLTSQLLDRCSGQIVLFTIVLLSSPFIDSDLMPSESTSTLYFGCIFLGTALFLHFRIRIRSITQQTGLIRAVDLLHAKHLIGHYGLSLIIQLMLVANFCLAAAGLGLTDRLLPFILAVPLVLASITLLPFTVADWGSREAAAVLILTPLGSTAEAVVSASIVYGLFHLLASLPGGLILLQQESSEA